MADEGRKVFIGGLDYELHGDDLRLYFSKYGGIEDTVVIVNDRNGPFPGRSRGFGFVTFNEASSAQKVMESAPHKLGGKAVDVKLAVPKDKMAPTDRPSGKKSDLDDVISKEKTKKLFIGGIPSDMTEDELMQEFSEEGAVSVDIMMDKINGKGRGFAFIMFNNEEIVEELTRQKTRMFGNKEAEMKKAMPVGKMREVERSQGRGNRYDDYGRGGGGPMRNNRGGGGGGGGMGGGFRDNNRGNNFGGGGMDGYRDNRGGGGGGYDGGMRGGYNDAQQQQNWGNYMGGNMGQANYQQGYGGAQSGGYGGYGGGYGSGYGDGQAANGGYSTAYPSSYGGQSYGQGSAIGPKDPNSAFNQLQQAMQNFVSSTNQMPSSEMLAGLTQATPTQNSGYTNSYTTEQKPAAPSAVGQRAKQTAPYYR